jgi:hypothetical protein
LIAKRFDGLVVVQELKEFDEDAGEVSGCVKFVISAMGDLLREMLRGTVSRARQGRKFLRGKDFLEIPLLSSWI